MVVALEARTSGTPILLRSAAGIAYTVVLNGYNGIVGNLVERYFDTVL